MTEAPANMSPSEQIERPMRTNEASRMHVPVNMLMVASFKSSEDSHLPTISAIKDILFCPWSQIFHKTLTSSQSKISLCRNPRPNVLRNFPILMDCDPKHAADIEDVFMLVNTVFAIANDNVEEEKDEEEEEAMRKARQGNLLNQHCPCLLKRRGGRAGLV